jgi:hypothetical protein
MGWEISEEEIKDSHRVWDGLIRITFYIFAEWMPLMAILGQQKGIFEQYLANYVIAKNQSQLDKISERSQS